MINLFVGIRDNNNTVCMGVHEKYIEQQGTSNVWSRYVCSMPATVHSVNMIACQMSVAMTRGDGPIYYALMSDTVDDKYASANSRNTYERCILFK